VTTKDGLSREAFSVGAPHTQTMQEQRHLNRASERLWVGYTQHRVRVTSLIREHSPDLPGRLVVLGAGNCNDLELPPLADGFAEVHLVDIDAAALAYAISSQNVGTSPAIRLHGGVDVTRLGCEPIPGLQLADIVVSAGLLTQLINSALHRGRSHHDVLALRDAHLKLMASLLRAGGTGLLITDVVSSDTYPQLRDTPPERLSALLPRLLDQRNFFTGCNPFAIARRLGTDPTFLAAATRITQPWRWDIGTRSYLVCALAFRRRPGPSPYLVSRVSQRPQTKLNGK
jgi:hypothetical protein